MHTSVLVRGDELAWHSDAKRWRMLMTTWCGRLPTSARFLPLPFCFLLQLRFVSADTRGRLCPLRRCRMMRWTRSWRRCESCLLFT